MCEQLAPDLNIVKVLSDMMEHENLQVRTHVNGTLYSILTRYSLKQQANQIGMADILQYLMQNSDETLQRQIQYIYNQLQGEPEEAEQSPFEEEDDADDEDEEDYEDDEDGNDDQLLGDEVDEGYEGDLTDTLKVEGVLTGEEWLSYQFMLGNEEALIQTNTIDQKIASENQEKLEKSDNMSHPISNIASSGPNHENPFGLSAKGYANPGQRDLERSVPSAMKSRQKIPRTPDGANPSDPTWKIDFQPADAFDLSAYLRPSNPSNEEALNSIELDPECTLSGDRQGELHAAIMAGQLGG